MPTISDGATCMAHTGLTPFTGEEISSAGHLGDRKPWRALLPSLEPENDTLVRDALLEAGRSNLIGGGCNVPIPARPPRPAIEARRRQANYPLEGDHFNSITNPAKGEPPGKRGLPNSGYWPGGGPHDARIRRATRRAAVVDLPIKRPGPVPHVERGTILRPCGVS